MSEVSPSPPRRQPMRRVQSEKSLGASQAAFGASNGSLLSAHNESLSIVELDDDESSAVPELKHNKTTFESSPPRQAVFQKGNSLRQLFVRHNSEKSFGASYATFAAESCSSFVLSANLESQSSLGESDHLDDESSVASLQRSFKDFPEVAMRNRATSQCLETLRSNSRRQLMRRAESEQSLGASFANFGASCRSLLSTSVLEEDSFVSDLDLDQSLTGITDLEQEPWSEPRAATKRLTSTTDEACSIGTYIWSFVCSVRGILQQPVVNPMGVATRTW
jgi:hypothetical protein